MFGDDPLHEVRILDAGEALIVEDHVVALRPVGLRIDRHLVVGARAPLMDDRDVHPRPRRQPRGDHLFLAVVVVAAAAGDVEHLHGLARLRGQRDSGEKSRQGDEANNGTGSEADHRAGLQRVKNARGGYHSHPIPD